MTTNFCVDRLAEGLTPSKKRRPAPSDPSVTTYISFDFKVSIEFIHMGLNLYDTSELLLNKVYDLEKLTPT